MADMKHQWKANTLALQQKKPPVRWFPKCARCGCLITEQGKTLYYRATPNGEWSKEEPPCQETC